MRKNASSKLVLNRVKPLFVGVLSLYCFQSLSLEAQTAKQFDFDDPLKEQLRLSGNFGELRGSHFHAGLDLKTNLTIGKPVYAAADGYVSRLKVAHFGYGKALYLTHEGGYGSVYAHLDRFAEDIQNYIKNTQYKKERFQVELFPSKDKFVVKKGDLIGYTGNTGSSGGPHLHFEIRDPQSRPLNPLNYGIEISDTKSPMPTVLRWYPHNKNGRNVETYGQNLSLTQIRPNEFLAESLTASGRIGFGIGAYDQQDGSSNKNGVYRIKTSLNGALTQDILFDRISFDESKFMNRYMDYRHYRERKQRVQKLFRETNNPLGIIKILENDGYVSIEPGASYVYRIELMDHSGNQTTIDVPIVGLESEDSQIIQASAKPQDQSGDDLERLTEIPNSSATSWSESRYSVFFSKGCFYESTALDLSVDSDILRLDRDRFAVYKPIKISYRADHLSQEDLAKAYIAHIDPYGKPIY
ncbi:MAG: M23 family metallopeptidase, partial [Flavobacteriaceae bacterium]